MFSFGQKSRGSFGLGTKGASLLVAMFCLLGKSEREMSWLGDSGDLATKLLGARVML